MPMARVTILKIAAKAARKKVDKATESLQKKEEALEILLRKTNQAIKDQEAKVARARDKLELLHGEFQRKQDQLEDEFPDADDSSS